MKQFIYIFLTLIAVGCCKKPSDKGIVVQDFDFGYCIPTDLPNSDYVIDSEIAYQSLLNSSVCDNYSLPAIDFNQYTLLGKFASGKCKVQFYRSVKSDAGQMKYIYTIKVCDKGFCKKQGQSMNWVLVPKLPSGYTVSFLVEK